LLGCYAISSLLSYLLAVVMVYLSQKIIYTLRREVFEHLTTLPVSYFDTHQTGDIISRISYDIDTLNASLSHDLLQVCASLVTVAGALLMMISISPVLVLVFAVTVPASLLFTRFKSRRVRPLFKERSAKLGALNGYAEEMLSGQKTVRAYSRENVVLERFDTRNNEAVEAYYRADWYGAMIGPAVNLINNISIAMITVFGGVLFMLSNTVKGLSPVFFITLGGVSAFVQYSRKFAGPINELANIMHELQSGIAAAERVFRLLDEPSELADKQDWTVLSTGGVLKKGALSLNGSSAEKMINSYHVNTVICSCRGLDTSLGVTDSNENDSLIKQAMIASAERKILAVDSEKFDRKSFVKVCDAKDIDIIVTDRAPSDKWQSFCSENEIEIVY
jgi:ATP-binding cassette subfamily B protein